MTERALPGVRGPVHPELSAAARPRPVAADHGRPARSGAADRRREALVTTPSRVGILLGASAALYAVTLAGVSAWQADADAATAAIRAPSLDGLVAARSANDAIEAELAAADRTLRALAGRYDGTGADLAAYEARLDELAALVSKVEGSAASLPARVRLPSVSIRGSLAHGTGSGPAPATVTRCTGSGC